MLFKNEVDSDLKFPVWTQPVSVTFFTFLSKTNDARFWQDQKRIDI